MSNPCEGCKQAEATLQARIEALEAKLKAMAERVAYLEKITRRL